MSRRGRKALAWTAAGLLIAATATWLAIQGQDHIRAGFVTRRMARAVTLEPAQQQAIRPIVQAQLAKLSALRARRAAGEVDRLEAAFALADIEAELGASVEALLADEQQRKRYRAFHDAFFEEIWSRSRAAANAKVTAAR